MKNRLIKHEVELLIRKTKDIECIIFNGKEAIMSKTRVMVKKYGCVVVDADSDSEAIDIAKTMQDSDFDWSDFDDPEVVENDVDDAE